MEKKWRTVIGPKSGLLDMDVKEIWKYRDLCLTFIRKNYITKYKQTVFGPFYMILSPLLTSGIFTVVFGTAQPRPENQPQRNVQQGRKAKNFLDSEDDDMEFIDI